MQSRTAITAVVAVAALLLLITALPTGSAQGFEVGREVSADAGGSHATVGLMCSSFETGGPTPQCLAYREVSIADDPLDDPWNVTVLAGTSGAGGGGECVDRNCLGAHHQDGGTVAVGVGDMDGDGDPDAAMEESDLGAAGADHYGSYAASTGHGCNGGDGGSGGCAASAMLDLGAGPHEQMDRAGASAGLRDTDGDGRPDDLHLMAEADHADYTDAMVGAGLDADTSDDDGDGTPDGASAKVIKKSGVREVGLGDDGEASCHLRGDPGDGVAACQGQVGVSSDPIEASWQTGDADAGYHNASADQPGNTSAGAGGAPMAGADGCVDDPADGRSCAGAGADGNASAEASTEDEDGDGDPDEVDARHREDANGRKTVQPRDL